MQLLENLDEILMKLWSCLVMFFSHNFLKRDETGLVPRSELTQRGGLYGCA